MTKNLNKLFIDVALIDLAIKNFDEDADVEGPTTHPQYIEYIVTRSGEKPARLHVHIRNDGSTTLNAKVGANQALSQLVGEHIAEACKKAEFKQRQLGLASISTKHWKELLAHLETECKFTVTQEALDHAERYRVKKGPGDEVNIHRYTTSVFLMQGKCREVYGAVAAALCALLPNKRELVDAQLKSLDVEGVKADDLIKELGQRVPNAMVWLDDVGSAIIAPCLALTKFKIDLPDYSAFAYPALRGLEYYMKAIMAKYKYPVKNEVGFGNFFAGASLKASVRAAMGAKETYEAVEISYALYNKHRHGLFHADANPMFSRTIDTQAEATAIVDEVLLNIEQTASKIK